MKIKYLLFVLAVLVLCPFISEAQVMYQPKNEDGFSFGSYGRVGVDWNFENGGSIGRRLNLNNMGSIGGRMEEQDYLELTPSFHFTPFKEDDPTLIKVQMRFAVYSQSLSLFGNSTTSSEGGLTIGMPEIYAEAKNINGKDLSIWIGARLYRTEELFIADHFYFDDHSGQGFGIELKNTRFSTIFVSSTDTSANTPPYFYLNVVGGESNVALRQRSVLILEQDINISPKSTFTAMGEFHRMGGANSNNDDEVPTPYDTDTSVIITNYPNDYGFVLGAKLISEIGESNSGAYNKLALRYGTRIANGGDGGHSKTWGTYGAPDLDKLSYKGAYSFALVDEVKFDLDEKNNIHAYVVYTHSKGGAETNGLSDTYWGREVFNRKIDFTTGIREVHYFSDKFHLLSELHYSQRKDGDEDTYAFQKLSISPTFVPTGKRDTNARPHLRFVVSLAHYNNAAKNAMYSPYLEFVGPKSWGHYFGVKMEWWI